MSAASLALTERLADRLCHDFASSAQAVASGLDLLQAAASPAERDEAEAFLAEAVAVQKARIAFARRAYGAAQAAAPPAELEALAQTLFRDIRPELSWQVPARDIGPLAARALLVLAQLATDILAVGGRASLGLANDEGMQIAELDAEGPKPMLRDDVRSGLTGEMSDSGLGGRWAQGAFLRALAKANGGDVRLEERPHGFRIRLNLRPGV